MKTLKIALLIILLSSKGIAQNVNTQKLDSYFNTLTANDKFMGSVAILKEGKVIYNKQVGYANVASKQKPVGNTKYRIGSISKVFTATLIFKAIENGMITLDKTIDAYFPEIKNADEITISNLLNHRSGIHSFTDNKDEFLSYHTQPKTEKKMLNTIAEGGSDFKPGVRAAYSNSNYVLLSYILEKLYRKPYGKILEDEIAIPLNLRNTFFGSKINPANNEAYGYRFKKRWKKTDETDPSIDMGAGGIVSTPTDLIHFAEALFNHKIVSGESLSKMKTIQDNFGMGLFKIVYYNEPSYGHNGEIDGFTAVLRYFPEKNIAFAITSNGLNYSLNPIAVTLVNSLFNKHIDIPDFRIYKPKSKELNPYLGVYSSHTFSVKLTITKSGNQLHLQAPGDSLMNLQATAKGVFKYEPAGITIMFDIEKNQMQISQEGKTNLLTKE